MNPELISKIIEQFADFILRYLIALSAVGALSMAILEIYKKVMSKRQEFHYRALEEWIYKSEETVKRLTQIAEKNQDTGGDAFAELLHLITGSDINEFSKDKCSYEKNISLFAVLSLNLEKMMGHVQEAVDSAIDNPQKYPGLYFFATTGEKYEDAKKWYSDAEEIPEFNAKEKDGRLVVRNRTEQYARLRNIAKRKLDSFQLQVDFKWSYWNQKFCMICGGIVLFLALLWINFNEPAGIRPLNVAGFVIISLIGGILAPVAKDLTTLMQKVKQRG